MESGLLVVNSNMAPQGFLKIHDFKSWKSNFKKQKPEEVLGLSAPERAKVYEERFLAEKGVGSHVNTTTWKKFSILF